MSLVKTVHNIGLQLPSYERYGLNSQLRRSAISIPSNIAEGCSRTSRKDFRRFLEMALGSAFELETLLELGKSLNFSEVPSDLDEKLQIEQKMLHKLIKKINEELVSS